MAKPLSNEKLESLVYSILATSLDFRENLDGVIQRKVALGFDDQQMIFETTQIVILEYETLLKQLVETNSNLVNLINNLA